MRVDKFNISWQIVRAKARNIKNVDDKINYIVNFLNKEKNIHNFGRVINWLKMTALGYKGVDRKKFDEKIALLLNKQEHYTSLDDSSNDFDKVSKDDLELVYKDLSTRKYGFQYKSVPKAHVEFMSNLKAALDRK